MFRASDNFVLISTDLGQVEPRWLAHFSNDYDMINTFESGRDIYAMLGERIFKVSYEECQEYYSDGTKNPEGKRRRDMCKQVLLSVMYQKGARTLGETLGISKEEAQGIINSFYSAFPTVRSWMDEIVAFGKEQGYGETAFGRKRRNPDLKLKPYTYGKDVPLEVRKQYAYRLRNARSWDDKRSILAEAQENGYKITDNGGFIAEAIRQHINFYMQGTSSDQIKLAMIAIHNDEILKSLDCHLLATIHDETVCECPIEHAKEVSERIMYLMIHAADGVHTVVQKADTEITKIWYGEEIEV